MAICVIGRNENRYAVEWVEHYKKLEAKLIPEDIDYEKIEGLRIEARQKLTEIRPRSVGQASRIFNQ